MIQVPSITLNSIDLENTLTFYMVRIHTWRFTSLPYDVTYENNLYVGDSTLVEVALPESNSDFGRSEYTIVTSHPVFPLSSFFTSSQGRTVEVYVGFLDVNNQPILSDGAAIKLDKAVIDTPSRAIESGQQGQDRFTFTCCTPLLDLDAKDVTYTSQDYATKLNPTDTSFEQVFENSGQISVRWGKG